MNSNTPPGCNSDDGGIDHQLEGALESLCDKIDQVEVARALEVFIPTVKSLLELAYKQGYIDGGAEERGELKC